MTTSTDLTDRDQLRNWIEARDDAAFSALVERHGTMVHAVCRRICGDRADADDAAQETFAALARQARSVKGSLPAWLHVVATRRAWRVVRRRRARVEPGVEVLAPAVADTHADLDNAIAALPEDERAVVVLSYLRGMTQEEVAAETGLSQPTVHRRLDRALTRLRDRLAVTVLPTIAVEAARKFALRCSPAKTGITSIGGSLRAIVACAAVAGAAYVGSDVRLAPLPHPDGVDIAELAHGLYRAFVFPGVVLIACIVVETLAWWRTRRLAPWFAIALGAALPVKMCTFILWAVSAGSGEAWRTWFSPSGVATWLVALVGVVGCVGAWSMLRRDQAVTGNMLAVLRAILVVLVAWFVVDAMTSGWRLGDLPKHVDPRTLEAEHWAEMQRDLDHESVPARGQPPTTRTGGVGSDRPPSGPGGF